MLNKKILLLTVLCFTCILNAQNRRFELIGNDMTEENFNLLNSSSKSVWRKYDERKRNKLVGKKKISQLKRIALFNYFYEFERLKKYKSRLAFKGKSFLWFQAASNLGDKESLYNIGIHYLYGYGVEKNKEKAFSIFKELSDDGFDKAIEILGTLYYYGSGVEQNIDEGSYIILSLKDSLLQPDSHITLGDIYLKGHNIKSDTIKAVDSYLKSIRNNYVQNILLDLLYTPARKEIEQKFKEVNGNSEGVVIYLYTEVIRHKVKTITPQIYYDYARVVLKTPSKYRTREVAEKAIDYYKVYKDSVTYASNEDHWFYGRNLYYLNYLYGDPNLAQPGVDQMKIAATKDNRYARELSGIYRNSSYKFIRNLEEANFWELKADLYDGSNAEISEIMALATGINVNRDLNKAYKLVKRVFERSSKYDDDFDTIYYLYYSLCSKSKVDGESHCNKLEKSYAQHIYCWSCDGKGKYSCDSCKGSGRITYFRTKTAQCNSCNGFGYLRCKPYRNLPKEYILTSLPSNYKNISHLH